MLQLFSIFLDVVVPVFTLVFLGYVAGPALKLDVRTLSRTAYFIFVPALIFQIISRVELQAASAAKMLVYIVLVHILCALTAFGLARMLNCSRQLSAAYVIIAVSGNVGNFGLPLIRFRFGEQALAQGTIYFLGVMVISLTICVIAASWARDGSSLQALISIFKTPALIAVVPALLVNVADIKVPLMISRVTELAGAAMVPLLLIAAGVHLAQATHTVLSAHVFMTAALRLIAAPCIALLVSFPLGIRGQERATGILQTGMPVAIVASIISLEYQLMPEFVATSVLFTSVIGMLTLTVLLSLV
ncbi:transporter [candidate division KSB3 bacterium]|uniref:Transporter n=1 Tax=candidate division KSB3 bacterium TaxID=2044937 RepID=A0A2G6EGD8_9BACT|nr:MAG: transporter [candidate division KSB3 bacterium]PIE31115.1 MAG: transporter [candidate division KSB3 bacterium]